MLLPMDIFAVIIVQQQSPIKMFGGDPCASDHITFSRPEEPRRAADVSGKMAPLIFAIIDFLSRLDESNGSWDHEGSTTCLRCGIHCWGSPCIEKDLLEK